MRKYPKIPHPFVLCPPLEEKTLYEAGESFSFTLTLIGSAIEYLPYFIYTFEELGRMGIGKGRGRFELSEVLRLGEEREEIYNHRTKILKKFKPRSLWGPGIKEYLHLSSLTLNFLTPTRLKYNGRLILDLEFHILLRNLLRRIATLSYFHCGEELSLDFRGLLEKAKKVGVRNRELRWYDWERYSHRQETRMRLGGFVGRISFEGEIEEFKPYLLMGEYIHVGKGTGFGLGRYEIAERS